MGQLVEKHAKHKKVRFRRRDMRRLEGYPSASVQAPDDVIKVPKAGGVLRVLRPFGVVAAILVIVVVVLVAVAASGLGTSRLQQAAQSALTSIAGEDVSAKFGDARLTWKGPGLIGLELRDARFETSGAEQHVATAEGIQFGIKLTPFFSGEVELSGVNVSGLHVSVGQFAGSSEVNSGILNERGLVDPDQLANVVFSAIANVLSTSMPAGEHIRIDSAEIEVQALTNLPRLIVENVDIKREPDGLSIDAVSRVGETEVEIVGQAMRTAQAGDEMEFEFTASVQKFQWSHIPGLLKKPFVRRVSAQIDLTLSGTKKSGADQGSITSFLSVENVLLETFKDKRQTSNYEIQARLDEGSGKIEIERLAATIGQTQLDFHGAIQPAPADYSEEPVYRFELVSDGSNIAALDSPERPIGVFARLAGIIDPGAGRLSADEIRVRTNGGEVFGNAALVFPGGKTPAAFLAIKVPKMPVPHAKQLWPWKAADGARSWVLQNVFGGEVRNSWLEMSVVAGRFGDGIPFRPDEISGHFEVFGTRFDTAGEIPPVRDANGTIDFGGTDVTIRLSSGTAYLPSGRTVDAADGAFEIAAAVKPLIGALEIDVAGEADAVAELSTFQPIDAARFIDLAPEDFSGTVSGRVSGNIPLQEVPDPDALSWRVALDYENLSIAKPFAGQTLADASGSIIVVPQSATINAKGLLNELPAEIALVEPLSDSSIERVRDIRLVLDDKARAKTVPALNTVLSGPVVVDIVDGDNGIQQLTADLTRAKLHFPWAGWSKGSGIPAKASFTLKENDETIALSDINLSGDSFSLRGTASLVNGEIDTARFDDVKLNRDDQFDLSIDRQGRGYKLSVSGKRIDARSLIRQFLSDPDEASEGLTDTPVTLEAKAGQVMGFGDEIVSDVSISYSGTGTKASGLQILATTASGKGFAVSQSASGGGSKLEMQSADAGAILRFLDIYGNMQGGSIDVRLSSSGNGPQSGQIDARDFWIVNEPRLEALVATAPEGDGRSLSQAVRREIDVSKAKFDQGYAQLERGGGSLSISNGVLRGPLIGSTFQGQLYDPQGLISITGTFMPAYGLNRLFADIPLVGLILGNGRDRGLIGITYKLSGDAKSPRLQVNPISVIAPGIFRSIFEFQ